MTPDKSSAVPVPFSGINSFNSSLIMISSSGDSSEGVSGVGSGSGLGSGSISDG